MRKDPNERYRENSAMQMIGHSTVYTKVSPGGTAHDDFQKVIEAYSQLEKIDFFTLCLDFFSLGYIIAKKEERAKRHN